VRFSRREHLVDGLFLGLKARATAEAYLIDQLTDLKLLIGKSQVFTVRLGEVAAVAELRRSLRSGRDLVTPVDFLAVMVSAMTKRMEITIFDLTQDTDATEDAMLDRGCDPAPDTMIALRRRLFRTRRQLTSVQQILAPLATDPALPLDADDRETLIRSANHVTRYLASLEDCRARIQMLEDHIDAQRATTMTRASLNLTIVATVFLPLTFMSGLLGMNVAGIPEEHDPWGFWIVSGLSILIALLAWVILRRRLRY
jgi:zinc transporter